MNGGNSYSSQIEGNFKPPTNPKIIGLTKLKKYHCYYLNNIHIQFVFLAQAYVSLCYVGECNFL